MRRGFSLLELMVVTALLATVVTAVAVLLRSGQSAWDAYDSDHSRLESAHGTLRHLVRQLRQATDITAISGPSVTAGNLSASMSGGATYSWSLSGSQVLFNKGTGNQLLADNIDQLSFVGYKADGVTTSAVPGEIQSVDCRVQVVLPQGAGVARQISCRVWLRSW